MKIYLINLARRPDRLAAMTRALDAAGLTFTRIEAVDAHSVDPAWLDAAFTAFGPLGPVPSGDKACTLSHFKAYEHFLSSPEAASASHAVILEDDIRLAGDAGPLLSSCGWLPPSTQVLKIERYRADRRVLLGPALEVGGRDAHTIAPLFSEYLGAAGYIISKAAATALLAMNGKLTVPIDHLLFNPNNSPIFDQLKPALLLPPLVQQQIDGDTDIGWSRHRERPRGWRRIAREIVRGYYKRRRTPAQIAALALGRARYVTIGLSED
jgi:glycosyl transferase family 25